MTASSADTRLQLTDEVILSQLGETRFTAAVIERGIPHTSLTHWTTAAASLDAVFPHALTTVRDRRESSALLDLEPLFGPDALAHVRLTGGTVYVSLAGPEPAVLDASSAGCARCCRPHGAPRSARCPSPSGPTAPMARARSPGGESCPSGPASRTTTPVPCASSSPGS